MPFLKPRSGPFFFSVLFVLSVVTPGKGQSSDLEAGLFNIGIGSVLGGVGAVINKEPGEKFGKVLLKGLGQGALGGYAVFESQRLVREFAESGDFGYVWPAKLVNSAGSSIIENAAANRDFWEKWHLNFGFNRIKINTAENFRLSYRIMPFALAGTIYAATDGKLNLKTSLRMGTFVFETREIHRDRSIYGQARVNSILILNEQKGRIALPHELIHNFQYERLSGFNAFFDKPMKNLSENHKIVDFYNKIFYTDFNALLHTGLYTLANPDREHQSQNNFFEREADYFTDTLPRQRYLD